MIKNTDNYKEFYLLKYPFDRSYLSEEGAKIFTKSIPIEFLKLIDIKVSMADLYWNFNLSFNKVV